MQSQRSWSFTAPLLRRLLVPALKRISSCSQRLHRYLLYLRLFAAFPSSIFTARLSLYLKTLVI